ncbi:MAG: hypothetical protein ABMA01_03355 [Chthoniobacteraceae bacterium]
MKRLWEDFIVTGFGTATSYATAFIMWIIQEKFDFALYSLTLNFIIPAGAILCGVLGATGYYFGSKLFGHRPSRFLLVTIVLVAASTYFLIYWMEYYNHEEAGFRLRNHMEFSEYLDHRLRNTALRSYGHGDSASKPSTLGDWGYAYGLLQVAGFSLGGFAVFGFLRAQPYCERCARYLVGKRMQSRIHATPEDIQPVAAEIGRLLEAGEFPAAIAFHAGLPGRKPKDVGAKKGWFVTRFHTRRCATCANRFLEFKAFAWNGQQEKPITEWKTFTEVPVEIG